MCFKDQTFCASDCTNTKCFRNFSQEQRELNVGGKTFPASHQLPFQISAKGVKNMYILSEFRPYENCVVSEFDTEEEVKAYLRKAKAGWGFQSQYFTLYEVVQEIDVNEFMEKD